jgi:lipoate-protein ligase B
VWVGPDKLGSVGIAVRRGIGFHGFALNVNTDLEPFRWINPCGLEGIAMTSMERLLGRRVPMAAVRRAVRHHIQDIFGVKLQTGSLDELQRSLGSLDRIAGQAL